MTCTRTAVTLGALGCALLACASGNPTDPYADPASGAEGGAPPSGSGGSSGGGSGSGSSGGPIGGDDGGRGVLDATVPSDGGAGGSGPAVCTKSAKTYDGVSALGSPMPIAVWICVPPGMESKSGPPAPLVVALHGYTQGVVDDQSPNKAWGFKPTTEWEALAGKHKFYLVYADKGTAQYMSAFKWFAGMENTSMGIARSDTEPTSIAQIVADMKAQYPIDPGRVFVNGLSAGAYMVTVLLATYPDVFAGGAMFEGGAYGCSASCGALGKKGQGWTWPGNHAASLVTDAWSKAPSTRHPRLLAFQGDQDGAVTIENLTDVTQQWTGAYGVSSTPTKTTTLKGHEYSEYGGNGNVVLATILMKRIGHGTPVDPGPGVDQGGWDPVPSQTMQNVQTDQDWTNTAGIYGPYYAAKFWGIVP